VPHGRSPRRRNARRVGHDPEVGTAAAWPGWRRVRSVLNDKHQKLDQGNDVITSCTREPDPTSSRSASERASPVVHAGHSVARASGTGLARTLFSSSARTRHMTSPPAVPTGTRPDKGPGVPRGGHAEIKDYVGGQVGHAGCADQRVYEASWWRRPRPGVGCRVRARRAGGKMPPQLRRKREHHFGKDVYVTRNGRGWRAAARRS